MIYLDTSAALKLVRPEAESDALGAWLEQRDGAPRVSSLLLRIELIRAVRRTAPARLPQAHGVLRRIDLLSMDAVAGTAETIGDPVLRSLDALHPATAERLRPHLTAFVAYDTRLRTGARELGLPVQVPT